MIVSVYRRTSSNISATLCQRKTIKNWFLISKQLAETNFSLKHSGELLGCCHTCLYASKSAGLIYTYIPLNIVHSLQIQGELPRNAQSTLEDPSWNMLNYTHKFVCVHKLRR